MLSAIDIEAAETLNLLLQRNSLSSKLQGPMQDLNVKAVDGDNEAASNSDHAMNISQLAPETSGTSSISLMSLSSIIIKPETDHAPNSPQINTISHQNYYQSNQSNSSYTNNPKFSSKSSYSLDPDNVAVLHKKNKFVLDHPGENNNFAQSKLDYTNPTANPDHDNTMMSGGDAISLSSNFSDADETTDVESDYELKFSKQMAVTADIQKRYKYFCKISNCDKSFKSKLGYNMHLEVKGLSLFIFESCINIFLLNFY